MKSFTNFFYESEQNSIPAQILHKLIDSKRIMILLPSFNRNFPKTDSSIDFEKMENFLWNIKLHESKTEYNDDALNILNRIAKDKDNTKLQIEMINFVKNNIEKPFFTILVRLELEFGK